MDELIDLKNFEILSTAINDKQLIKSIRLLTVFGNIGTEVIFITNEDNVYGFGQNKSGCLGLSTSDHNIRDPRLNKTLSGKGLIDIVSGFEHCIGLTSDGKCYGWGYNDYGRLGTSTYKCCQTPVLISEMAKYFVVEIACGAGHTLALTRDGKVYSWGRNNWGQLGIKNFKSRIFPNRVEIVEKVIGISCGRNNSVAVVDTNQLYFWGLNDSGESSIHQNSGQRTENMVKCRSSPTLISFPKATKIRKAMCGPYHTLILTFDGIVFIFGEPLYRQIDKLSPIKVDIDCKFKDIAVNNQNCLSLAVTEDNKCYVWGIIDSKIDKCATKNSCSGGRQSLFDIYSQFVKYKITFKTIVVNEDKHFNAIKFKEILELKFNNLNTFVSLSRGNGSFRKSLNSSKNASNRRYFENKKPINESSVSLTQQKPKTLDKSKDNKIDYNLSENNSKDMSDPESDWEDYHSCFMTLPNTNTCIKFIECLNECFDKQNFSDLKFIFDDKKVIYCHKSILMIRNLKFWQKCVQYLQKDIESAVLLRDKIYMKSYSYESFYAFLQYLYGFEPILDNQMIDFVLNLAQIYQETQLIELCLQFMQKTKDSINLVNICTLYEKSVKNGTKNLEKLCIEFSAKNWKTICRSDAFQAMNDCLCERLMTQIFRIKN